MENLVNLFGDENFPDGLHISGSHRVNEDGDMEYVGYINGEPWVVFTVRFVRGEEVKAVGNDVTLYVNYVQEKDGTIRPIGYAYGKPWVYQALLMGDMSFDTPEEAKEWWEKNYG